MVINARVVRYTAVALAVFAMTACSDTAVDDGKPSVVATTNVWGSIATAIAGDDAHVSALITDANADPHSFELSPAQAADLTDADLVVYNGGGYDSYVGQILQSAPKADSVNAFDLRANKADTNEHVWFDYGTVLSTAHAIADRLGAADPTHAGAYQARAQKFENDLKPVQDSIARIAATKAGATVTETEPVPHYLVISAGLVDVTPPEFQEAIEEGTDPSPAATASFRDILLGKKARVLLYNIQSQDNTTEAMRKTAESAGVRILEVTETLPARRDYLQWQSDTVNKLAAALA